MAKRNARHGTAIRDGRAAAAIFRRRGYTQRRFAKQQAAASAADFANLQPTSNIVLPDRHVMSVLHRLSPQDLSPENGLAKNTSPETRARPSVHDRDAVELFRREHRIDPDRVRRMRHALYQLHEPLDLALRKLGSPHADAARKHFDRQPLRLDCRCDSSRDGSSKLVFMTADGRKLETVVLRAESGRMAVCVSTQVGCDAGCPFCATGRMGLGRDLSSPEILEQIVIAAQLARAENKRLKNVVFMGMGEPLDNEDALLETLDTLLDPQGFAIPPRRLLVSTVGIPDPMVRLSRRHPGLHVGLSLHSARPELRNRLVPWSRRHSWQELRDALQTVAGNHSTHRHQGPVMIEHIMIAGVNDGPEDVSALIDYLDGIRAHVNLIPFNPFPGGPPWQPTERSRRDWFAGQLREAGLFTTIRYSMGADIQAACGQLATNAPSASESVLSPAARSLMPPSLTVAGGAGN